MRSPIDLRPLISSWSRCHRQFLASSILSFTEGCREYAGAPKAGLKLNGGRIAQTPQRLAHAALSPAVVAVAAMPSPDTSTNQTSRRYPFGFPHCLSQPNLIGFGHCEKCGLVPRSRFARPHIGGAGGTMSKCVERTHIDAGAGRRGSRSCQHARLSQRRRLQCRQRFWTEFTGGPVGTPPERWTRWPDAAGLWLLRWCFVLFLRVCSSDSDDNLSGYLRSRGRTDYRRRAIYSGDRAVPSLPGPQAWAAPFVVSRSLSNSRICQ